MESDLEKLLDLQVRDRHLRELDAQEAALMEESELLDRALRAHEDALAAARRAAAEAVRRRVEIETRVDGHRGLQERRREQLEAEGSPRVAATIMAELDLVRSMIGDGEAEWMRAGAVVESLEANVAETERALDAARAEQGDVRAELDRRRAALTADRERVKAERAERAERLEKRLRVRYDRLLQSRGSDIVIPVLRNACGACFTAIPFSRRSQLRPGMLDVCEACGVMLYLPPDPA